MTKKYIDAEAAIKVIQNIANLYHETYVSNARAETVEGCLKAVNEIPAADVVEVKHGYWVDADGNFVNLDDDGCPVKSAWCSVCNDWLTASDEYPTRGYYCPNCGTKMEESENNGTA